MATYSFDSAYIIAHLQNNANERLKHRIRVRMHWFYEHNHALYGWAWFEQACLAAVI